LTLNMNIYLSRCTNRGNIITTKWKYSYHSRKTGCKLYTGYVLFVLFIFFFVTYWITYWKLVFFIESEANTSQRHCGIKRKIDIKHANKKNLKIWKWNQLKMTIDFLINKNIQDLKAQKDIFQQIISKKKWRI